MFERVRLFLELAPAPLAPEQVRDRGKVRLELGREGKVQRGEVGKAGDAQVKVDDVVAVVGENLAEEGSLADARCAEENGEARNGSEGTLEDSELRWSLKESWEGREGMRRWYCRIGCKFSDTR